MKRKTNKPIDAIGKVYTIFTWNKCCLCENEFRRERGWWAVMYHHWYYLCNECGGDSQISATQSFLEWDKRRKKNRPDPPLPMGLTEDKTKTQRKTLTNIKSRPKVSPPRRNPKI